MLTLTRKWPRVLIADDEQDMLQVLTRLTKDVYPDACIKTAHDGKESLRELVSFEPDLLITDLEMPHFNGIEVCRRASGEPQLAHIKVLAVSGHTKRSDRMACFNSGVGEFIAKPFEPHELKMTISRLLGDEPSGTLEVIG